MKPKGDPWRTHLFKGGMETPKIVFPIRNGSRWTLWRKGKHFIIQWDLVQLKVLYSVQP